MGCCLMQILPLPLQRHGKKETKCNDLIHQKDTENVFAPHLQRRPGGSQKGIFEIDISPKTSGVVGMQIEPMIEGDEM